MRTLKRYKVYFEDGSSNLEIIASDINDAIHKLSLHFPRLEAHGFGTLNNIVGYSFTVHRTNLILKEISLILMD